MTWGVRLKVSRKSHLDSPVAGGGASVRNRWHWCLYSRHFCTVSERDTVAPCAGRGETEALCVQPISLLLPVPHTWFHQLQGTLEPQTPSGTGYVQEGDRASPTTGGLQVDIFTSLSLPIDKCIP